ncbi:TetR/AcrR family transcriptional regulator [Bradyrhizobium sp. CCGB12]|uniref:TetR/AcrR family transcriptional regulator n=1 Tax=Bradyrhizobium sp. CCGB12 TaxID=2949632 RepID=UPI0020B21580|nr:TetR/AcrR family transcriptional regulator [Bradyrhizobium sp. CCGB12]MCP3394999.1 TetR/AcrR family transcriptional regulator [Bradyrhizobium sp. CCGB12]
MNRPVRTGRESDEARARILGAAEERFRRVGHHRTSVAEIAAELGMSPANIYRFFPSRIAIDESICGRLINEVADIAFAIARTDAPATEKLEQLLPTVHHHTKMMLVKAHARSDRRRHAGELVDHSGTHQADADDLGGAQFARVDVPRVRLDPQIGGVLLCDKQEVSADIHGLVIGQADIPGPSPLLPNNASIVRAASPARKLLPWARDFISHRKPRNQPDGGGGRQVI